MTSTAESGSDDIFIEVHAVQNGSEIFVGRYFDQNPLKMKGSGDKDDAYVDITINEDDISGLGYIDALKISLYDNDASNGWNGKEDDRDTIGHAYIYRDETEYDSYKVIDQGDQGYGKGDGRYHVYYRIIDKPIQTLRVFGIKCDESSRGCNVDAVEAVFALAEEASSKASDAMDKSPRPRAKAISKGFDIASEVLGNITDLVVWLADALEGDDEVYIQHVDRDNHNIQGGGWPQAGGTQKMNNDQQFTFGESGVEYIRVPMDRGPVTLQLRERDPYTHDACIGSYTFDESYYNKYKDTGSRIVVTDHYFRDQSSGQGALYQLCISMGLENWAVNPVIDEQEAG